MKAEIVDVILAEADQRGLSHHELAVVIDKEDIGNLLHKRLLEYTDRLGLERV